jgi:hypothetical protein
MTPVSGLVVIADASCKFWQAILNSIINSVMGHIAMRPSRPQVAVEVAEWQAKRPAALAAISRHLGDG